MGVAINDLKLLLESQSEGNSFQKVLTLGRLSVNIQRHDLEDLLVKHHLKSPGSPTFFEKYGTGLNADDLFRLLGAQQVDSIDNSNFEGATIVHDLNKSLPAKYENLYDLVFDGGTLEHVFNFPVAIHNAMRALKVGGRFVIAQVANNDCGHGFYCFSPELFYQVLSPAYGFKIRKFLGYEADHPQKIYAIPNPRHSLRRVLLRSKNRIMILVEAEKMGDCSKFFESPPYQFDYAQQWSNYAKAIPHKPQKHRKHSILHDIPWYARLQAWRSHVSRQRKENKKFNLKNPNLFEPYQIKA
jgi:SAM-dependent methyltransferase